MIPNQRKYEIFGMGLTRICQGGRGAFCNFTLIHPFLSYSFIGVLEKSLFKFSEPPIHVHFEKKKHSKNFQKLSSKTPMLESSLSCSEQLFCREPIRSCFCKKNSTANITTGPSILKTCKAEGCSF